MTNERNCYTCAVRNKCKKSYKNNYKLNTKELNCYEEVEK